MMLFFKKRRSFLIKILTCYFHNSENSFSPNPSSLCILWLLQTLAFFTYGSIFLISGVLYQTWCSWKNIIFRFCKTYYTIYGIDITFVIFHFNIFSELKFHFKFSIFFPHLFLYLHLQQFVLSLDFVVSFSPVEFWTAMKLIFFFFMIVLFYEMRTWSAREISNLF